MAQTTRRKTPGSTKGERSTCLAATAARLAATVHPHDLQAGGAPADDVAKAAGSGWIRSSYRLLMMRGLSTTEAGNVVAYVAGLHASETGWSTRQIESLVALRSLVACGVIAS